MATKINHAITAWQRQITGDTYLVDQRTTDQAFRAKWRLLDFHTRLARNRVLMAFKVHEHSAPMAWQAASQVDIDMPSHWLHMARQHLTWYQTMDPNLLPSNVAQWQPTDIQHWLHTNQAHGPAAIRRLRNNTSTRRQLWPRSWNAIFECTRSTKDTGLTSATGRAPTTPPVSRRSPHARNVARTLQTIKSWPFTGGKPTD